MVTLSGLLLLTMTPLVSQYEKVQPGAGLLVSVTTVPLAYDWLAAFTLEAHKNPAVPVIEPLVSPETPLYTVKVQDPDEVVKYAWRHWLLFKVRL